jgi:hypothetical protein
LALLVGRFRLSRREAEEFVWAALGGKAGIWLGSVKNLESRTAEALKSTSPDQPLLAGLVHPRN